MPLRIRRRRTVDNVDGDNMNRQELIEIFDNENTRQCNMLRDDPTTKIDVYETEKLLEITVKMTQWHEITIFYGTETEHIDITSENYIGLGSALIEPIKDIKEIDVKWR